jgi:hypothetical protein
LFCFGTELGNSFAKDHITGHNSFIKLENLFWKLTYTANWDDFDKVPFGIN